MSLLIKAVIDLIFPPMCAVCQRTGRWWCQDCQSHIPWMSDAALNLQSLQLYPGLHRVWSAVEYTDGISTLLTRIKQQHLWQYIPVQAAIMDLVLRDVITHYNFAALIPVPTHRHRRRERGFDHTRRLAEQLGQWWQLPVWQPLVRVMNQRHQAGLSRADRQQHQHDYQLRPGWDLTDCTVLLVDDVCTTGATLSACARALGRGHPKGIYAATLARTV